MIPLESFDDLSSEARGLLEQAEGQAPEAAVELWRRVKLLGSLAHDRARGFEQRRLALDLQKQAAKSLGEEDEVRRLQKLLVQVATEQSMFQAEVEAKSKHIITDMKKDLP